MQRDVTLDRFVANGLVAPLFPQLFKLSMKIEDERRMLEPARLTASVWMQPNHEEALAADAEAEVRRRRIGVHARVPLVGLAVDGVK